MPIPSDEGRIDRFVDRLPKTLATVQPALAKLEIMVGDVVIRTEVEVDHLAAVILAMRASR